MTFEADLVQLGEWDASAKKMAGGILQDLITLVASTGTNGSSSGSSVSAVPLTGDMNWIATATSSSAGNAAILVNKGSGFMTVWNNTAFSIYVFAPVGGTINNFAATGRTTNTGATFAGCFQIATNKSATFVTPDGVNWYAQHAG